MCNSPPAKKLSVRQCFLNEIVLNSMSLLPEGGPKTAISGPSKYMYIVDCNPSHSSSIFLTFQGFLFALVLLSLSFFIHWHQLFSDWPKAYTVQWTFEISTHDVRTAASTIIMSRTIKVTGYHVKFSRFVLLPVSEQAITRPISYNV